MLRKYLLSAIVLGLSLSLATCRPVFAQEQIQIDATARPLPFRISGRGCSAPLFSRRTT
jgi:hypothetical protein